MGQVDDLLIAKEDDTVAVPQREQSIMEGSDDKFNDRWCTVDSVLDAMPAIPATFKASPVEEHTIHGRRVYIKRDDLLRLPGSSISGNKARKMLVLNELEATKFPRCLVSNGGPQSNSMLALAAVVNYKNRQLEGHGLEKERIRFVYYTKKLPRFLRKQASGNLFRATSLGMELQELSHQEYQRIFGSDWGPSVEPPIGLIPPHGSEDGDALWVPQGGAFPLAQQGAIVLAQEIVDFWKTKGKTVKPLTVVLPGGTCTTAVLVHHAIKSLVSERQPLQQEGVNEEQSDNKQNDHHHPDEFDIEVVVIPCVGDGPYAQRQMMALSSHVGKDPEDIPHVLAPAPKDAVGNDTEYFTFADPHRDILDTFESLKDHHNVVLDLVYGAPAWTIMLRHWTVELSPDLVFDPRNPLAGREIMYIHSGGLEGINSQLLRYKYKGLLGMEDIQLP